MVKLWDARTPSKFRFSAKFPQVITHVKKFRNCQKELELFYEAMEPLKDKLLTLLIQFPPSKNQGRTRSAGLVRFLFRRYLQVCCRSKAFIMVFRFSHNFFKNNKICLVWNQLDIIQTPPVVTSDFVYIRFLGDRSISETDFCTIQRNRVQEMAKWADKLKRRQ